MSDENENKIAKAQPRQQNQRRGPMGGGGPPGMALMRGGEKPKDFKASAKKLLAFVKPFRFRIAFVVLLSVCATVLSMILPRIQARITDEVSRAVMARANGIEGIGAQFDYGVINNTLLLLLMFQGISMVFAYAQGFTMTTVTTTIAYNLRNSILEKINKLPVGFFHSMSHGDVLSRLTNDVDTLSQSLTQSITQAITTVITLVVAISMMLSMSLWLTLIAFCMVPGSALVTLFMVKVSQKYFRKQQNLLGTVNGIVEEIFSGHTVVKAFNGEERVKREFDEQNDDLYNTAWKAQFLTGFMMPMMNFIGNLGYVAICMVGAYMVTQGTDGMTVGGIQAFITYIRNFTQPITQLANISSQLQSTAAAAERVFKFLDEPEEQDIETQYNIREHPIAGSVTFENVKFAYEYVEEEEEEGMEAMFEQMRAMMDAQDSKAMQKEAKKAAKKSKSGKQPTNDMGGRGTMPGGGFGSASGPPPADAKGDGERPAGFPGGMPPGGMPPGGMPSGMPRGSMPRGGFSGGGMPGGGFAGGGMPGGGMPGGGFSGGGFPGGGFSGSKPKNEDDENAPKKKKSGELVIKDFSAEVKAGQKVAIVGPTGAGKTTMVKLLMRFHDLNGGKILVDGRDIARYKRRDLRTDFGMVLQDTWLFNGTIMENIRYGKPDATDEEVYTAARAAQVDHFVRTLSEGYEMVLNEETTNISQGQKQLLTIARAILADAKILILDEATSSVDTRTEILIQRAMDNLLEGRTSFIIAHRLSTIRNADLILCMRDGDIVEQGTHEELMEMNGFYAQLYNSQFEKAV